MFAVAVGAMLTDITRRIRRAGKEEDVMDTQMIVGEAQATVEATPNDVFDFVLDLNRYRQADHKIGRVREIRRSGNTGTVRFSGRLRGVPGPTGVYPFTLTESRLVFGSPVGGSARWFLDEFEGSFDCDVTDAGTVVTHREVYRFKRPWRGFANLLLRRWLEKDTAGEMERLKTLVEGAPPPIRGMSDGAVSSDRQ